MTTARVGMFTNLDEAPDPAFFIALMDRVQSAPDIVRCRHQALGALRLEPGQRFLDVGCGTGEETRAAAGLVAPGGQAIGVDFSQTMISEAQRRTAGTELPVEFEVGDAQQLPFDDVTFDACRSERMLCHVPDPVAAVAEMYRVTRSGGRIAVIDADLGGTLLDHPDHERTGAFLASLAELRHPWMGRQLPRLLKEAGLDDISVEPVLTRLGFGAVEPLLNAHVKLSLETGNVDADRLEGWLADLEYSHLAGTFFMAMPAMVVAGRKP
jgi:ubiquinone/menaquinone biosynthesis C-methylase UbiE